MGISRFFQLLLLLGFLATGMVLLQQERQILEQEGNALLQRLQQAQEQARTQMMPQSFTGSCRTLLHCSSSNIQMTPTAKIILPEAVSCLR